ncbi:FGGY family carbohydrate kinase [Inquilinus limosus]|uniref:FGGY family carbohydrate kinase n=1 Tax=Inquilinus limosus TaxID=171674 RepID=UPI00068A2C23|nr:FGGY family carbohydrate kinase [Inquilinus limosus]
MSAWLGIDAGNTGVKALLFDDAGRELACAHRDTGGHSPEPGMVERDIGRLRTDLAGLVRELLDKSGLHGRDIAGIGTSGHGNGLYLLDAEGGPLAAIQSLDSRTAGLVEEWTAGGVGRPRRRSACSAPGRRRPRRCWPGWRGTGRRSWTAPPMC